MRPTPLAAERLEDRTTPATTLTWTGAVSASWADPGNWVGNAAPTGAAAADEVLSFPAAPVRLTSTNDLPGGPLTFTRIDVGGANYAIGGGPVVLTGATAVTAAAGAGGSTLALPVTLGAGAAQQFDVLATGAGLTVTGVVSDTAGTSLAKVGAGTLTLQAANTYAGTTTVSAGTLRAASNPAALGSAAGGTVVATGARLEVANLTAPTAEPLSLAGTLASTAGSNFLSGTVALSAGAAIDVTGSFLSLTGVVSGPGGLLKTGPDILGLSGANTYGGGTVIRAGLIDWGNPTALGTGAVQLGDAQSAAGTTTFLRAGAGGTVANPVTVTLPGSVVGSLAGAGATTYAGTITLALPDAGAVFFQAGSAAGTTYTGRITGTGDIAAWSPDAPGRVITLDNATGQPSDFHRATAGALVAVLPDAVLRVVVGPGKEQLPDDATVLFGSTASALELAGAAGTETVAALASNPTGAGVVRTAAAGTFTLRLSPATDSLDFSGQIVDGTGALAVTKAGAGTLALSGPLTVAGPLTVSAGPLVLTGPMANGAASPDVVVTGTGVLRGTGTIAGTVAVQAGGRLAPGDLGGQGVLPTGALTFQPGATYGVNATVAGGVTTYGRVSVTGTVNLGGAALAVGLPVNAAVPPGTTGVILANDGTDPVVGTFAGLPEGGVVTVGNARYRVSYVGGDGNDVTLTTPLDLTLAPTGVPGGLVGTAYSTQLSATGAAGPFTFTVTAGALPAGVTLGAAGLLAGTPTAAGTFNFTVTAANAAGDAGSRNYVITVGAGPAAGSGRPVAVGGATDGSVRLVTRAGGGVTGFPVGATGVPTRAAVGDVNGDGTADVVAVTGPGVPLRVSVMDGATGGVLVAPFDPFGGDFTGGGYVAAGDLDGDGKAEFVVTPDQGGGPRVSIYSFVAGAAPTRRANFFGIDDANFRGGARAALGDVNGDRTPDVVVAAGFGGGPRTAIFTGQSVLAGAPVRLVGDFFAFPGTDAVNLRNGSFVAAGDVTGDGFADLVFGGGPGGAPRVFVLSGALVSAGNVAGAQASPVANFFVAGDLADRGGARVAVTDADGDTKADVVVGSGAGRPARVRLYLGKDFGGGGEPTGTDLNVLDGAVLADGVYVG